MQKCPFGFLVEKKNNLKSLVELSEFSDCGKYAQNHLPMYSELIGATPAESAYLISKDILKALKIDYPSSLGEIKYAEKRVISAA